MLADYGNTTTLNKTPYLLSNGFVQITEALERLPSVDKKWFRSYPSTATVAYER
jgi:hypothetical protein